MNAMKNTAGYLLAIGLVATLGCTQEGDGGTETRDTQPPLCAYGSPGRCSDVMWPATWVDGRWRCLAYSGYPGGIPVEECAMPDGGDGF